MRHFIEKRLAHLSTRKDDKDRLQDCLETLDKGRELDGTQTAFIRFLQEELQDRAKRYAAKGAKSK